MLLNIRMTGNFKFCQAFSREKTLFRERDTLIKLMNTFIYLKTGYL